MIAHTSEFKDEIKKFGRQITGRIYQYNNYNLVTEANDTILTEDNLNLMSEQPNLSDKTLIDADNIFSIDIIKNGQLLQSLMKQCNFNANADLRVGTYINAQLGLLVNESYEYLDYGDYIIYSKEYNADDKTYSYVCYDKMLYTMVKYKPLSISYPVTVRNYIDAICNEIGLTFANASDTFTNYNQNITADMYADKEITYRDILDDLSEIVAGNICINNNGELEIRYPVQNKTSIFDESTIEIKEENGITSSYDKNTGIITFNGTCTGQYSYFEFDSTFKSRLSGGKFYPNVSIYYIDGTFTGTGSFTFQNRYINLTDINVNNKVKTSKPSSIDQSITPGFLFYNGDVANNFKVGIIINDEVYSNYEYYDTINEEYLKDINVSFSEKFGPINKVIIRDTDVDIDYTATDDSSIEENGVSSIIISDNLLTQNGNQDTIAQNILTKLNGLSYYLNDFSTTGVCYYEFLDLFNVNIDSTIYPCLLLNNEINITTGLKEQIFTERKEETESETYKYETSTLNSKSVTFKINQQEGKIESKVEKNGVISAINQSAEQISIDANKISLAGKNINLTSDNITIDSTNFSVDENGNLTCNNANINGTLEKAVTNTGTIKIGKSSGRLIEFNYTNQSNDTYYDFFYPSGFAFTKNNQYVSELFEDNFRLYNNNNNQTIDLKGQTGNITCVSLTQTSKKEAKKNFEKLKNALDIIKDIDIYKYNLKEEHDTDKKHIGFVIGDKYNYSKKVTSEENNAVDLYSFISVCCKAIQEQQEIIEELQQRIEKLERESDK